ncbi:hypothetical protein N7455_001543 [Penicillium solitum]|uniref:uncharacterized protein n=1 Tax=Penicillium solitum TaxID=60172 RepID=UPI0032C43DFA|nr:hypothetical protein N7455_001543 [Penicillium solitum]
MAPPGIEPGLTQIETTTMCRHTTRPWHLFNIKIELNGRRKKEMAPPGIEPGLTQIETPQCVVIPLDHGTCLI